MVALNAKSIANLSHPKKGQLLCWEDKLQGFGVRVTSARKVYVAQARGHGRTQRVTIGDVSVFTIDEARREAKKKLGAMASDIDLNKAKREARAKTITLGDALDAYLMGRDLKKATAAANRSLIENNFGDWLTKELQFITPAMLVQRYERISKRSTSVANGAARVFRVLWNFARADTANADGTYVLPETRLGD